MIRWLSILYLELGKKTIISFAFHRSFWRYNSSRYSFEDDLAHATWSISFHQQTPSRTTQYIVNKFWRQMNFFDNLESNEINELKEAMEIKEKPLGKYLRRKLLEFYWSKNSKTISLGYWWRKNHCLLFEAKEITL